MSSFKLRDPHVKDKTVSRPSYPLHENPILLDDGFYNETGPCLEIFDREILVLPCIAVHQPRHPYIVPRPSPLSTVSLLGSGALMF